MKKDDLDQILSIEEMSFVSPWSRQSFQNELGKDFSISLVAEVDRTIVGYLIGWVVREEVHIINIAVHPEWRRRGIGKTLIQQVFKECNLCLYARLEVRSSNLAARTLYFKLGFHEIGIRKNYYAQEGEDAILMVKRL